MLEKRNEYKSNKNEEAFRERSRHLHVCDLWSWGVTFTLRQGQDSLLHSISLIYCTLVPGMMSVGVILTRYDHSFIFLLPLTFICNLRHMSLNASCFSVFLYFFSDNHKDESKIANRNFVMLKWLFETNQSFFFVSFVSCDGASWFPRNR